MSATTRTTTARAARSGGRFGPKNVVAACLAAQCLVCLPNSPSLFVRALSSPTKPMSPGKSSRSESLARQLEAGKHYSVDSVAQLLSENEDDIDAFVVKAAVTQLRLNLRNPQEALAVFARTTALGVEQSTLSYNAAIAACASLGDVGKAFELFDDLQLRGLEPDIYTYNTMISACEKDGQLEKVCELFDDLQLRGLEPGIYTYNKMISSARAGQLDKAFELFGDLQQRGLKPDVFTYTAMISACDGGQWEKAFELFAELQQRDLEPDVNVYNAMMSVCIKGRQGDKGIELFKEAERRKLKPPRKTYEYLLMKMPYW
mmetsp:Transcript_2177/g.6461  ORF Transcript_2177/g.6461 Transcript_2177/m.6461 type:complete len:317 (+) Transcript_2177:110-1060(+)